MPLFNCPKCGSSGFREIDVEFRVSNHSGQCFEIRQQEACCKACNWVPSEEIRTVTILRKIPMD